MLSGMAARVKCSPITVGAQAEHVLLDGLFGGQEHETQLGAGMLTVVENFHPLAPLLYTNMPYIMCANRHISYRLTA